MWNQIFEAAYALGVLQWLAVAFALAYIYFAAKDDIICWLFGILSSGLWAYVSWFQYQLLYDSALNLFYVGMGVVGWTSWRAGNRSGAPKTISILPLKRHITIIALGVLVSGAAAYIAIYYTEASLPFWDALTTVFSVIATFLLIEKRLHHWTYWIIIDAIYIGIYTHRGAYLFAALFVVYTVVSVVGLFRWSKILRAE